MLYPGPPSNATIGSCTAAAASVCSKIRKCTSIVRPVGTPRNSGTRIFPQRSFVCGPHVRIVTPAGSGAEVEIVVGVPCPPPSVQDASSTVTASATRRGRRMGAQASSDVRPLSAGRRAGRG